MPGGLLNRQPARRISKGHELILFLIHDGKGLKLFRPGLPNGFWFTRAGAQFQQVPAGLDGQQFFDLVAKGLLVRGPVECDLAEDRFEMVAGQRADRQEIGFTWIEISLEFGLGENDPALAAFGQDDPLGAVAVLFEQRKMLGGSFERFFFQLFFDAFELLVKESELLMKRKTALDELWNFGR